MGEIQEENDDDGGDDGGDSDVEDYDNDKDEGMKNIEKEKAKTLCTYFIYTKK